MITNSEEHKEIKKTGIILMFKTSSMKPWSVLFPEVNYFFLMTTFFWPTRGKIGIKLY